MPHYKNQTFNIVLLASVLVVFSFWLQGNIGINLADEGYLWYGTWRTAHGEIPMRDFQSYDPGRYYWGAVWSKLFGDGIMALRLSTAIFQALGLTFGLLALQRVIRSWWGLAMAGLLLLLWMYPRHKLFEHSLAMMAVYFVLLLLEHPSLHRHFSCGILVGVAAFLGRNHGLYGVVSFFSLIISVWLKIDKRHLFRRLGAWAAGICVGYAPMLLMIALVPGFFQNFIQLLLFYSPSNPMGTRIHLPVPWPWTVDWSQPMIDCARSFSTGMFFLILPGFYILAGGLLLRRKGTVLKHKALLVASIFIGIPYMHHVFDRADLSHLAQGIHPLLIGLLALPFMLTRSYEKVLSVSLLVVVCLLSFFSVGLVHPYSQKVSAPEDAFVRLDIHGDSLWVDRYSATLIQHVGTLSTQIIQEEELLIAPHWPGFYPILKRKSPLWQIYFLRKQTEWRQHQLIAELQEQNVRWVILGDVALDGRDDLRFRFTHDLLWNYIMEHFEPVETEGLPGNYQLQERRIHKVKNIG